MDTVDFRPNGNTKSAMIGEKQTVLSLDSLSAIAQTIPGSVMILGTDKKKLPVLFANAELLQKLDYQQDRFLSVYGKSSAKLYTFQQDESLQTITAPLFETGKDLEFKCQLFKNGHIPVWFLCRMHLIQDQQPTETPVTKNAQTAYILAVFTDINQFMEQQQKLSEQASLISMTKVQLIQELEYERYLKQITAKFYEHIFEIDLSHNGLIGTGPQEYLKQLGITAEITNYDQYVKAIAKQVIHADYRKKFIQLFSSDALMQSFTNKQSFVSLQCRGTENGKDFYWLEISARVFFHPATETIRCITYHKNIDRVKKHEIDLLEKAQQDSLTQLCNKRTTESLVDEYLQSTEGKNGKHALLMIDLDNFKKVNDSLGHAFGDKVLSEFADEMKKAFRDDDILGRIGGDEFIVLVKNYGKTDILKKRVIELCENMVKNYDGKLEQYSVSASLGVSLYPDHGTTYKELHERSDNALYYSKGHGKNTFTFFNDEISLTNSSFFRERDIDMLINSSTDGIGKYAFDKNMTILYYNKKLSDLFGYEIADMPKEEQQKTVNFIFPTDKELVYQTLAAAQTADTIFSCTYRILRTDGRIVHTKVKGMFTNEQHKGKYPVFYLLYTDVSDLAELNEDLSLRQQKMTIVNEFTDDLIYEYDTTTSDLTIIGNAYANLTKGIVQVGSKAAPYVKPAAILAKNKEILLEILNTPQELFAKETVLYHKTKGAIPFMIYGKKLSSASTKIIGKMCSMQEQARQKEELETNKRMLACLNRISILLLSSSLGTFDERLNRTLAILGEVLFMDTASICKIDNDDNNEPYLIMLYEWTQQFKNFVGLTFIQSAISEDTFKSWISSLQENKLYIFTRENAVKEKDADYLKRRELAYLCTVPIHIDGKLWGILELGSCIENSAFTEQQAAILKMSAQLISAAIEERSHRV